MQSNQNIEPTNKRRFRKWPWITLLLLFGFMLFIRVSLKSDWFLDIVRTQIETRATAQLNGQLQIDRIQGDLLKELTINGILISDKNTDPVTSIDSIYLNYNVWSFFSGLFKINEISVINPWVLLAQSADENWNILDLLPETEELPDPDPDTDIAKTSFPLEVSKIRIDNGNIDISSAILLPDTSLSVRNIFLDTGISLKSDDISVSLRRLQFQIDEKRLSESIAVDLGAGLESGVFTLDNLSVATGRTVLNAYAQAKEDGSEFTINSIFSPLSWRDVLAYVEEPYFVQDLNIEASVSGSISDFNLKLNLSAVGLNRASINLNGSVSPDISLNKIDGSIQGLDLPVLINDPDMPKIGRLDFNIDGYINPAAFENSQLTLNISAMDIRQDVYRLDRLSITGALEKSILYTDANYGLAREQMTSSIRLENVFDEKPTWQLTARGDRISPGIWAADPSIDALLNYRLSLKGEGFEPSETPWLLDFGIRDSRWDDQPITAFEVSGKLTDKYADLQTLLRIAESELKIVANVENWQEDRASYAFDAVTSQFNLAVLTGLEAFPTSINLTGSGTGEGFDPESMRVSASLIIEESVINNAAFDRFQANLLLEDAILHLDETFLNSAFAEGRLDVRQNIFNIDDRSNRVDFNLNILDVSALAPLLDLEEFSLTGNTSGQLRMSSGGIPEIRANVSFHDIVMDSITVERITGRSEVLLIDAPTYEVDFRVNKFLMGDIRLDDFWFRTSGEIIDSVVTGRYRADIEYIENTGITTQANYFVRSDSISVETYNLDLFDDQFRYNLSDAFFVTYFNDYVNLSPVKLIGLDNVELILQVEQYAAEAFRGSFSASSVNLAILQRIALNEEFFDGELSGELTFDVDVSTYYIDISTKLQVVDFDYNTFKIDTLLLETNIAEERLQTNLYSSRNGAKFMTLQANVPFLFGDPAEFDDAFFSQPVYAAFDMTPLNLTAEEEALRLSGITGVSGILKSTFRMDGVAGRPNLIGDVSLTEGRLSGVAIDSLRFDWRFREDEGKIVLGAEVISGGQQAATLIGNIPFIIDWRSFEVSIPKDDENLDFHLVTNALNLSTFNEFVDATYIRNITGLLGADLILDGTLNDPQLRGTAHLRDGRVNLPQQNVTFSNIETDMQFARDRIWLERFTLTSNGTLTASGELRLDEGFVPRSVNVRANANNLRVSDTRDAQAFISLNTELTGAVTAPTLTGSLALNRGSIYLDNFGERTVEDIRLDDEEPTFWDEFDFWNDLTMEMKISADRNFWIRNRSRPEVNLQLNGELDLVKSSGNDVEIFGTMGANQGHVTQLGKRFTVERGDLTFSGPADNPGISVRALYALRQPSDIKIWYIIEGTAEEPVFRYESDPEMELQDIVSYTVFGRPFHALMSWEQTVSGRSDAAVADAAIDLLLDRVEQLASDRLGIDMLEIDNTRASGNQGTTIKAGKYVSDRLFVAFLQELGSNVSSQVMIEYMLRRNLELIITGSDNYQTGVDLMWKFDY